MFMPAFMLRSIVVLLLVLGAAGVARAEDAEGLIKRGVELRKAGRDGEALELFKRAHDVAPAPRSLAQMGLAEQALGSWPDAEAHLAQALASRKDPWIAKNVAVLQDALAAVGQHLGSLEVLGKPAGAEVLLDGRVVAKLPLAEPLRVTAGTVPVELRAPGYLPLVRTVTVVAGQLTRESVTLQPVPEGGAAANPEPRTPPPAQPPPPQPSQPTQPSAEPSRSPLRTAAWATLIGGAVFAVAGGVSVILREIDAENYNSNCVDPPTPLDMAQQSQCSDWKSGGDTTSKLAIGTLVTAGVLGATSAVLFAITRSAPSESRAAFACMPTPTLGLSCAARF
jgi:hypothetical protein